MLSIVKDQNQRAAKIPKQKINKEVVPRKVNNRGKRIITQDKEKKMIFSMEGPKKLSLTVKYTGIATELTVVS